MRYEMVLIIIKKGDKKKNENRGRIIDTPKDIITKHLNRQFSIAIVKMTTKYPPLTPSRISKFMVLISYIVPSSYISEINSKVLSYKRKNEKI